MKKLNLLIEDADVASKVAAKLIRYKIQFLYRFQGVNHIITFDEKDRDFVRGSIEGGSATIVPARHGDGLRPRKLTSLGR